MEVENVFNKLRDNLVQLKGVSLSNQKEEKETKNQKESLHQASQTC